MSLEYAVKQLYDSSNYNNRGNTRNDGGNSGYFCELVSPRLHGKIYTREAHLEREAASSTYAKCPNRKSFQAVVIEIK